MGQRTITKGTQFLTMANLTSNRLALANVTLGPGESKSNVPASDWLGDSDRARELAELVDSGSLSVTLNAALSVGDLESLSGAETQLQPLQVYADATRPDPASVPAGYAIFNTDDAAPNFSDGTAWRDAAGLVT